MRLLVTFCLVVTLLPLGIALAGAPTPMGAPQVPQPGPGAPNTGAWPRAFTLAPGGQAVFGISVGAPGPVQVGINWSGPPLAFALRDPSGRIQKQATDQRPPSVRLDHAAHAAGVWSLVISNPAPVQAPAAPAGQSSVPATAQGQVGANLPYANPVSPPTAAATGLQAAQPSQVAPAGPALSPCEMAGNCPPQGSIAITAPQAGTVWSTGSYHVIQWAFSGTRSTTADVTLWQNNQQVATVWTGSATGKAAYIVPFGAPAGTYELRVTLQADRRVEARQPVAIVSTAVAVTAPAAALVTGAPHTITWSYTGSITTMKLSVVDPYGTVVQSFPNVPAGSNGKGSWPWTAPVLPAGKASAEYRFQVSGTFHKDVTNNNAMTEVVLGTSNPFTVRLPKIEAGTRFLVDAGVAECSAGKQYQFSWTSELNGKPVKVELYKGSTPLQTIAASQTSGASNTITWTVPSIPETLARNYLSIRVTSLDFPAAKDETSFYCQKPWIAIKTPDPQQNLNMNQTYQIAWEYRGDPGRHVRVEVLSAKAGGYDMKAFETPAQSAPMQASGAKWGEGQVSWTLTNRGPHQNLYIQLQSVEDKTVWDRKQYYIAYAGSGGTSSGGVTVGSGSSGSGTSTTSGTSSSGATSGSGTSSGAGSAFPSNCSGGLQSGRLELTGARTLKYNPSDSATFRSSSFVTLDANCYALLGLLASDQQLKYRAANSASALFRLGSPAYFSNGYVQQGQLYGDQVVEYGPSRTVNLYGSSVPKFAGGYLQTGRVLGDQALDYRPGRSIYVRSASGAAFANGYVKTGQLASEHSLEYRAGQSTSFRASSLVTFRPDGYVQSGQLDSEPTLEYKPGGSTRFKFRVEFRSGGYVKSGFVAYETTLETAQGSQAVPAYAYVTFDDAGRMVSFNPPTFSACYTCDPEQDHDCSHSGGLPPCK